MPARSTDQRTRPAAGGIRRPRWLANLRSRVLAVPGGMLIWQSAVAILGGGIIVAGIVLLPLPGPGWLIIFLGFGIWATEFTWAARALSRLRNLVGEWTRWVRQRPRWLQLVLGAAGLILLAGIAVGAWALLQAR